MSPPAKELMPLHRRTSTFPLWTILPAFLGQVKCARCTIRVVHVYEPASDDQKATAQQQAVVEWGAMPYSTTTGRVAEFVYYTAESVGTLRPELLADWESRAGERRGANEEQTARRREWVADRLRDSWVIEQLVYWIEFLDEWKYYREYYVYREELFKGEVPEVLSPPCAHCGGS
ncbi:hypothetical protein ACRALDRAFT_1061663 [Sodiomyces alcalophilus JCM 7366]|uniref:uncharacterized protein n=1 Tax=Sodiomyces alcalophilus JCM 7366 TaxID=591952 RepID=UPI0039B4F86D